MVREIILANPLLWFFLYLKDTALLEFFYYTTLGKKINLKRFTAFSIILTIAVMAIRVFVPFNYSSILFIITYILGCIFILRFEILKSTIVVVFAFIAMILCEFLALLFFNQFNIPKSYFQNNQQYIILGNLICSAIFILITFFIYYSKIKVVFAEDAIKRRNRGMIFNVLISAFLISPNFIFFFSSSYDIPKGIILFNFASIAIFFALCTYNMLKNNELEVKKNELEYQKHYNETLNSLVDGLKTFKHDLANTLSSIGGYIETEDFNGLKKYFSELMEDYTSVNSLSSLNPSIINNPSVYGLIASKLHIADTKGVKLNLDISTDLNNTDMKIYELCKILGILLDNALEAAQKSDDKLVSMTIKYTQSENYYFVAIENSFTGQIPLQEIFKKGFSTKGQNRGLGLWEVKKLTDKYKSTALRTSVNGQKFRQEIHMQSQLLKTAI